MRRLTPYLLLAILMLGTGLGIGLGLSEASSTSNPSASQQRTTMGVIVGHEVIEICSALCVKRPPSSTEVELRAHGEVVGSEYVPGGKSFRFTFKPGRYMFFDASLPFATCWGGRWHIWAANPETQTRGGTSGTGVLVTAGHVTKANFLCDPAPGLG